MSEPYGGPSTKGKSPSADLISVSHPGYALRMYDDYKPSTAEWMDLLSIANTYGVCSGAIAQIEDIDVIDSPVKRLFLDKQLNIKKLSCDRQTSQSQL